MNRKISVLLSLFIALTFLVSPSFALAATDTKKETTKKTSTTKKSTAKKEKSSAKKPDAKASQPFKGTVNVNTASKEQLMQLPGIGPAKADMIIKARKKQGKFKNADDLMNVKGIGEKTLKDIKKNLKF